MFVLDTALHSTIHFDVIIAGAGIIGLSLALELRREGLAVAIFDAAEPGHGASHAAAGMLAARDPEMPKALLPLTIASAEMFPDFVHSLKSSGVDIDFQQHGTLVFHESENPSIGIRLNEVELCCIEPELIMNGNAVSLLVEDVVDPRSLTMAAMVSAFRAGITLFAFEAIQSVLRKEDSSLEVVTEKGRYRTHKFVNCAGAWANEVTDVNVPARPIKGHMISLKSKHPFSLRHVVRTPEAYMVPRKNGSIVIGATVEDVGFDASVDPATIEQLWSSAVKYVPELRGAEMTESWIGFRPGSPDKLPIMGATGPEDCFVATGHYRNGILLAPLTAKIMVDLLLHKEPSIDISAFSPQRFK